MPKAPDISPAADLDRDTRPLVLDVDSLLAIHRHDDGNIAICRKIDGKWENLWMLTPDMLRGTFRTFQEWLLVNSYASTQAYWKTAPKGWLGPGGLPAIGVDKYRPEGKRWFGRVQENLRYLNCLSLDIDCGRSEKDAKTDLEKVPWREAQRRVEDLQDHGIFPAVSLYGYSGRGLYVIWLLHDDRNPARSARAYGHDVVTWKAMEKELIRRAETAPLPVDHAGSLITQVYKIGGTVNPATGERARYFITAQADRNRRLISYTLSQVARFLDLPAIGGDLPEATRKLARPAQYRRVKNPGSAPLRSHGALALNALRAQDLLTLQAHRGGFLKRGVKYPDGSASPGRRFILTLYANFLKGSGADRAAALDAVRSMAANMRPPWPDESGDPTPEKIIETEYAATRLRRWTNPKLCALLGVSADLARELDLETIRPRDVALDADQARPHQADVIRARREWLRLYIIEHGGDWKPQRVMNLSALSPYAWNNHETARQDLNALGFLARSRGGRPRKAALR